MADADSRGPRILVRAGGAAQTIGGAAMTLGSIALCDTGIGCVVGAATATYGVDNAVAGARTVVSGKPAATVGEQALRELTGVSESTAAFIYGLPSMLYGSGLGGKAVASGTTRLANEVAAPFKMENIAKGKTITLPDGKYTYLGDGIFEGPQGGKIINTGRVDPATGNSIYQRLNADNTPKNSFVMMSEEGKQINTQKPESLKSQKPAMNPDTAITYDRPYLRKGTREAIMANYEKLPNGNYRDKVTRQEIKQPIDIGHKPGWEHRRLEQAARELNLSKKQFNDYVNARPWIFRLEHSPENQSHMYEMPGKGGIGRIKEDMKLFLETGK